ncbi:MAG: epoxyqueuosine reductase [Ruminococcaceae bacterium]|nr:epoxyqueuosine reductase [Oscillospiraceae bacterium]
MICQMRKEVRDVLNGEGIAIGGALALSDCRIYNEGLLARKMPDCQSVLLFAVPYYNGEHFRRNVSLYAAARDYHLYFSLLEKRLIPKLQTIYPNQKFAVTSDHSPIDERDAALKLGLGVKGDNHLVITKPYGSYIFLAEVLSTLPAKEYYEDGKILPLRKEIECLHCGACQKACPSPDACLSAITQKKGELSEEEIQKMMQSGIVWGCDVCQTVCPMNRDVPITPIPFFKEDMIYELTYEMVERMPKEKFKDRAFSFRGRQTILRNLKLYEDTK